MPVSSTPPRDRTPPLALRNVLYARGRSLVAIAGIGFASVMVLLQLGFLEAVKVTAAINYDQLDFDVALVSVEFEQFYDPGQFPRERLRQAESLANVTSAKPLYASMNSWRCPPYPVTVEAANTTPGEVGALKRWWLGDRRPRPLQVRDLLVLGVDPEKSPFHDPIKGEIESQASALREDDRLLFNRWSNPDFGWNERDLFQGWELGGRSVTVAGPFTLRRSFGADAAVLCDDRNFARAFGHVGEAPINFGLLKVRPGTEAETIEALRRALPVDVTPMARDELYTIEQAFWVTQTATGKIFSFGVFVTMVVAAVVVYQVLSNDVREHLPEYATLKAMGHTDRFLSNVVLAQAFIYATSAYLPAVVLGAILYRVTETLANIPMVLTQANLFLVLLLDVVAALSSGLLTLRRVRSADPADLF
ncbi:FtsX-like permease family protein [Singulisphaera sp. PoT]|uniref:FtsX-like permease family protein n=1 Tax=Singulisphaera sp. PoT TaxID=3411797 RepID=UPI003BF5F90E